MKTAIVLGTFDGLHAGHKAVIEKSKDFYSIAVTFEIPPKSALSNNPELLMSPEDRACRLKELGINQVEMQRFEDVKDIDAQKYLEHLKEKYNPHRIICGFNYRFGKGAMGDTDFIKKFCEKNSIEFICVPPVIDGDAVISSTNIRNLIRKGEIQKAASQIYGGFSFTAPIIHGDARGRELGFPTANQLYPTDLVCPKFGVYVSRVKIDGKKYDAITNIGIRPTYETQSIGAETYIKDFSADVYGKQMVTELLNFVREEKKFSSVDELKNAILNDVKKLEN